MEIVDVAAGHSPAQSGFGEARSIVLDPDGQFAYVSDGRAEAIVIFDRRNLQIEATIELSCRRRAPWLSPHRSNSCSPFAGAATPPAPRLQNLHTPRHTNSSSDRPAEAGFNPAGDRNGSHIIVLDVQSRSILLNIAVLGNFRIAQADDEGEVFVTRRPRGL